FIAKVIELTPEGVVLDQTLFYPEGGNQTSDKGVLIKEEDKFQVELVSKKGDLIVHHLSGPFHEVLNKGDDIEGEIDWDYRYGVMRAHSSQHVLSAIFKNLLDIDTVRANISFEDVSIHISRSVSDVELTSVLCQFITICTVNNLQFRSKIVPRTAINDLDKKIRGGITTDADLRIIEIEDFDINCCGGTHLAESSEIGPVYFYEIKKDREFKYYVGSKAIKLFSKQNIDTVNLARMLNTSVTNLFNSLKTKYFKVKEENERLIAKALELIAISPNTTVNGIKVGLIDFEVDYKFLSKAFKNFPPQYLLVMKSSNNKVHILSNNEVFKANEIIDELLKKYGGKGGGSSRSAQATLNNEPEDIISYLKI
ncbi:MAG: alanine--tRNA ligase-related protein, partial [Promethearchaeota archaeon]